MNNEYVTIPHAASRWVVSELKVWSAIRKHGLKSGIKSFKPIKGTAQVRIGVPDLIKFERENKNLIEQWRQECHNNRNER